MDNKVQLLHPKKQTKELSAMPLVVFAKMIGKSSTALLTRNDMERYLTWLSKGMPQKKAANKKAVAKKIVKYSKAPGNKKKVA